MPLDSGRKTSGGWCPSFITYAQKFGMADLLPNQFLEVLIQAHPIHLCLSAMNHLATAAQRVMDLILMMKMI